jgi:hypothetical protein
MAHDDRRDEAIVLIDPDFLFLNTFQFPKNTPPVLPGKPAGAKYGLGGQVSFFLSILDNIVIYLSLCSISTYLF